ncbi:MAG: glutaminyl-peptide cyclotransferase [Pyrinomonadaceae bacterium]|nr:glutaminyl-peptide cyclotransferase [Pyrinomonadaceae bacterium]MCX7640503.1 glutaminyl-peptide cyclotransferase [Pyrinomonadaceae bacterium]MDW8303916.1 glutaminyl-peptide cyclotransferase [Acidobacteriota bacterium]
MKLKLASILILVNLLGACEKGGESKNPIRNTEKPRSYAYEIIRVYPHDPKAFTQGLVYHKGFLYEGTGGRKTDDFHSSLRKVELETGKILQKVELQGDYFGEGITILNDKIYQLTWQENTAFVYDLQSFNLLKKFTYPGEGWGLTTDGINLFMSDGTHIIRVLNPENFETIRTIVVLDESRKPIMRLNELEYIKGEIWANVWQTSQIIRIDPSNGKLLGRIDLSKLTNEIAREDKAADVLNGIAYDPEGDRIFITGKKWRKLFEIRVLEK